ncbi:MAG: substrate-binding domain-containing protein [Rhodospirillales bacterium]|nr:substrate-binding domain-containing protein [Rhodospirillales bacterium]
MLQRRQALQLLAAGAVAATGAPLVAQAAEPTMVTVVKITGIPWFNLVNKGLVRGGKQFGLNTSMVGPAHVDPAQQVRLVEDLIARRVDVIGLVPLDVKVLAPVLKRAQDAKIPVITQEGPDQEGRTWDVELIDSVKFGEEQMKALAGFMGEEGEYVVYVGTLTTPLHNKWADAAIAYQKQHYPKMKLAASRYPGADEVDTSVRTTLDVLKAFPNLKGILGFGSNGPIGAGIAVRQKHMANKVAVVGTVVPSQAKPMIMDGTIKEGFLWSPIDAGYAMTAVAARVLKGQPIEDGMDVPGLGKAHVDKDKRIVAWNDILTINKKTIDGLIAQGL